VPVFPSDAFIHPAGDNRAEVESVLQKAVALLLELMTQADQRSPLPASISTERLTQWANIPEQSVAVDVLMNEVQSHVQHSMNAAHPGYIGHMDSIPTVLSIVGDMLAAALNNNMLSVEMSPVFSRLETLVLRQLAIRFGLGAGSGGVMVSGGSLANLQALTVARNVAFDAVEKGIVGLTLKPVFFVSEVAHTSMQKAAMMMGIGADAAIPLGTNENSQVDIADLKSKLALAEELGEQPFAIVATAGTTVTGNVDPIEEMGAISRAQNLWFHVDAAYGGAVIFSNAHRNLLSGIDQADSITFNPQKWLYVAKTCATVLFKRFDVLKTHFRIRAPYMGDDAEWPNLGELTVQGTRHADILKFWLSLQHIGTAGYSDIIRHNYSLTAAFLQQVNDRPYLQLASQPQMNLVCFRLAPMEIDATQHNDLNVELQRYLLWRDGKECDGKGCNEKDAKGAIFLSLPTYRGQCWLKAVLLNPYTTADTLNALFQSIDRFVAQRVTSAS